MVSLRGQTGLGSLIFNDGWFSGVTAATAKTNYSETTQTWLWLTSPSEDAVVQLPLKSIEYYQFLIFRFKRGDVFAKVRELANPQAMMMLLTLSLIWASPAAAVPADQAEGIAVMDLNAIHGVPQTLADLLNERLTSEVQASKRFQSVIAGSDLRAILILKQMQALGCEESNCLTQIGGALGVPYLMVPSVGMAEAVNTC